MVEIETLRHPSFSSRRSRPRVVALYWAISAFASLHLSDLAQAACKGDDLLNRMAVQAPADYAALEADGRSMPFGEGVLFRISRSGLRPSFLFGTLHVVDPRIAALSDVQRASLRASREVVLESLDFAVSADPHARDAVLASGASRASRLLSSAAFRDLATLTARRGFPQTLADTTKASALALMLDLPACAVRTHNGPPFLDVLVRDEARNASLPTSRLETTAEQVSIADDLPLNVQTSLLSAVLAQSREAESIVDTSVELYRQRRIGELLAWARSPKPIPGVAASGIPPAFFDRILDARTRRMRDRLLPALAKGGVFVAVGAMHVPGRTGLAALLASAGYAVETVE